MYDFNRIKMENYEETWDILDKAHHVFNEEADSDCLGFCYFNPNPRGAITGDCVKRAIVVAANIDYKELELMMNRNKVNKKEAYNHQPNYEHVIDLLGGKKIKMSVPAGMNRWHLTTINRVMHDYPHISYVLQVSKHLVGVRDETIFDLYDDRLRDKGIYKMFVFGATDEEIEKIQAICSQGVKRRFCL